MKMAEYQESRGELSAAASLVERALELFPNQTWKFNQTGEILRRLALKENGLSEPEELATTPMGKAALYSALFDAYRDAGNRERAAHYGNESVAILRSMEDRFALGLAEFRQGEILFMQRDFAQAYETYEQALQHIDDTGMQSDAYRRMAECQLALGNTSRAAALAETVAEMRPEDWIYRWTADFLLRLDMPDKAFQYYTGSVRLSSPGDTSSAYALMAEAYGDRNREQYLKYAGEYVDSVESRGDAATDAERGLAAYYQAKIHATRGENEEAYQAYGRSVQLLTDRGKRADAYMRMADYDAGRGENRLADEYAQKSLAELPNEEWKQREVADFYARLGESDKAVEYYKERIESATSPRRKAETLRDLAELYKHQLRDSDGYVRYAREYSDLISSADFKATPNEEGLAWYYQGEILMVQGDLAGGYEAYEKATTLLTDAALTRDLLIRIADYKIRYGDRAQAIELAQRIPAEYPEDWVYRWAGEFFLRLDMQEKALEYYVESVQFSSPNDTTAAYSLMAEGYGDRNRDQYLKYAGKYVDAVEARGAAATKGEQGLAAYYQAKIHVSRGEDDAAYQAYERSIPLLTDGGKRSDAYMRMAEYAALQGNAPLADQYAMKSLAELPNEEWKQREVANFYIRIGEPEKTIAHYQGILNRASTTRQKAEALRDLAELYKHQLRDPDEYARYAGMYRDLVFSPDSEASQNEIGLGWYYQGEILLARGDMATGYEAFEKATTLLTDAALTRDLLIRIADYQVRYGDRARAIELAERIPADYPEDWVYRWAGEFFVRLDMPDKALALYAESVRLSSPGDTTAAYSLMAEAYGDRNPDQYRKYAGEFIAAIDAKGDDAPDSERGLAAYYEAKIEAMRGNDELAYRAYERSVALLADRGKRADAYMRMAEYAARQGENNAAEQYAQKSLAEMPTEEWKQREVANFYVRLGEAEKTVAFYENRLNRATTPRLKAEALRELAELYKNQLRDTAGYARYAEAYRALVLSPDFKATPNEQGLAWYYQGEIMVGEGDLGRGYEAYEKATTLLTDTALTRDLLIKIADYQVRHGDRERAIELAERIPAEYPEEWVYRWAGEFFVRLDMPEKAFQYYADSVRLSSPGDTTTAYSLVAEAYGDRNPDQYTKYAGQYIAAIDAKGVTAPDKERGLAAYYQAKIEDMRDNYEAAYQAYERSVQLLADPGKRADAYMRMADYALMRDEIELSAEYARKSLAELPNEEWKQNQVADYYVRLGQPEKTIAFYEDKVKRAKSIRPKLEAIRSLAELYKRLDDTDKYLRFAGAYRDLAASPDFKPSRNEEGMAWYYHGEILSTRNKLAEGYQAYEKATTLLTDVGLATDILMKMAEYQLKYGSREKAIELAEQIPTKRPEEWIYRWVAGFFVRLDMPEKAFGYYDASVRLNAPNDNTTAYYLMAEAYEHRDQEQFIKYAREYFAAIEALGNDAPVAERGLATYYEAKVQTILGNEEEAIRAYERSTWQLADKGKRADAYMRLADYAAERGENELAGEYASKSAAELPNNEWKQRDVADFYIRIGEPEKTLAYYNGNLERARTPRRRADALRQLAELYKRLDDQDGYQLYAGQYRDLVASPDFEPTPNEHALAWYYQGEILTIRDKQDQAYLAFEKAADLTSDNGLRADMLMRMAEYQRWQGNPERAAELAGQAASLFPDDFWRQRTAADMYARLGMLDQTRTIMENYIAQTGTIKQEIEGYEGLLDLYRERSPYYYGEYARKLADIAFASSKDEEKGLGHFYLGEAAYLAYRSEEAYREYSLAYPLLKNKHRLADVARRQAEYHAERGDIAQAVKFAELSVSHLPTDMWRLMDAGRLIADLDGRLLDKGVSFYLRALNAAKSPMDKVQVYNNLARLYRDRDRRMKYNENMYAAIQIIDTLGDKASKNDLGKRWHYQGEVYEYNEEYELAYQAFELAAANYTDRNSRSEMILKQAEYHVKRSQIEMAVHLIEIAIEPVPDIYWRQRNAAELYIRLKLTTRAREIMEDWIDKTYDPRTKAECYRQLAEMLRGDYDGYWFVEYARKYIKIMSLPEFSFSDEVRGFCHFYQGEIAIRENCPDLAFEEYDKALALIKRDRDRIADIAVMRQAEYFMDIRHRHRWHKNKNYAGAIKYLEIAEAALPYRHWNLVNIARFYGRVLDRPNKSVELFERAIQVSRSPMELAHVYNNMADFYKGRWGKGELHWIQRQLSKHRFFDAQLDYMRVIDEMGSDASPHQQGQRWFMAGEHHRAKHEWKKAYDAYVQASTLIDTIEDPHKLSEAYRHMAWYNMKFGDRALAVTQAHVSIDLVPDNGWRARDIMEILGELKRFDDVEAIGERVMALNPRETPHIYSTLADVFVYHGKDRKKAVEYQKMGVDHFWDRVKTPEWPDKKENSLDDLWGSRGKMHEVDKSWGFGTYSYARFPSNGEGRYQYGGSVNINKDITLPNKKKLNVSLSYGGTFRSRDTGGYIDWQNEWRSWTSGDSLRETAAVHLSIAGNPFTWNGEQLFDGFRFIVEQQFPIGNNTVDELKFGLNYGRGVGGEWAHPRTGNFFDYWGYGGYLWYNTRFERWEGGTDAKLGFTYIHDRLRDTVFTPYAFINASYRPDEEDNWNSDIGLGITIKQYLWHSEYFRDRYNIGLNIQYNWPVTRRDKRHGGLSFTLTSGF